MTNNFLTLSSKRLSMLLFSALFSIFWFMPLVRGSDPAKIEAPTKIKKPTLSYAMALGPNYIPRPKTDEERLAYPGLERLHIRVDEYCKNVADVVNDLTTKPVYKEKKEPTYGKEMIPQLTVCYAKLQKLYDLIKDQEEYKTLQRLIHHIGEFAAHTTTGDAPKQYLAIATLLYNIYVETDPGNLSTFKKENFTKELTKYLEGIKKLPADKQEDSLKRESIEPVLKKLSLQVDALEEQKKKEDQEKKEKEEKEEAERKKKEEEEKTEQKRINEQKEAERLAEEEEKKKEEEEKKKKAEKEEKEEKGVEEKEEKIKQDIDEGGKSSGKSGATPAKGEKKKGVKEKKKNEQPTQENGDDNSEGLSGFMIGVIVIIVVVVVCGGGFAVWYFVFRTKPEELNPEDVDYSDYLKA